MKRVLLSLCLLLGLSACAESVWAPDDFVARSRYMNTGPTTITLFTVMNNRSNKGGHSALLISGSERILFDPAGTFRHPQLPERNDVIYGMAPAAEDFYIDYHARVSWRVVKQVIPVSPLVAEQAIQRVKNYGAVGKAFCTNATSSVLAGLPGFENIRSVMYPHKLMQQVEGIPGVVESVTYDDSPDNNGTIVAPDLTYAFATPAG